MPGKLLMVAGTPIFAGGERNLFDLARAALNSGYEVELAAPGEGGLTRRMRTLGCPVWHIPMPKLPGPGGVVRLRRLIRRGGFHIVHAHGHLAGMHTRLASLALQGHRVVYTLHGVHYPHYRNPCLARLLIAGERVLRRRTDHFICVCRHDLEKARELAIVDDARTTLVYNGIDTEQRGNRRKAESLRRRYDKGGGLVLHVGRFMRQKDHHTLIEAAALVHAEFPHTVFLLVGSGPLMPREMQHASSLGPAGENLKFLGERGDVPELMQACDFLVLSSLWEGFPYVVLEALRSGKAVVSTRVGGIPEVITDGVNGLLVKPGNPAALAQAMMQLLSDPERAAAMGREGRKAVERFSLQKMTEKTLRIYRELSG